MKTKLNIGLIAGLAIVVSLLSAASAAGDGAPRHALNGTWICDPSKSTFNGAMPYRSAVSKFVAVENGTHVEVDIIEANGVALHFEYSDAGDGVFVPVYGNPFYDSQSTVWLDKYTAKRTERRGGKVTGTTIMTVAADGKSYVARASRTRPDGKLYTSVIHWDRSDP